ncbi:MAG: hypothetical protein ACRDPS_24975 [Nocardioides sp.]|uniref:hypothetical protein n=1 Tax=Nocardioides sp. TaxID=35761 RepID=UPI003D6B1197
MAIPVYVGDVSELWNSRGQAWFGDVLGRMVGSFSFLWGSAVTDETYSVAPASAWPTLVFVVLLASLVYISLRTASDGPSGVGWRVLCVSLLAGGLTNLFVVVQSVLDISGGLEPLPAIIWAVPEDGIWLGLVVGVFGGYATYAAATVAQLAAIAMRRSGGSDDSSGAPEAKHEAFGWARASRVATWGALPILALALAGGFLWDYDAEADPYGADIGAREAWVRLVWFAHASLAAPHNPHSLSGDFDTSVWLPRTLSSAVLVVLVWLAMLLVVALWQRAGTPGVPAAVVQCWGVVVVIATVVGLTEGAFARGDEFATAHYWALEVGGQGVRFAAFFGWLAGVAVVLAHRFSRGARADAEAEVE